MTSARSFRPIPLTVGGIPDGQDIVGRDTFSAEVAAMLGAGQSILLTGDRRTGKTCVSRVVEAQLRDGGHRVIRVSAERASFADFVDALSRELEKELGLASELARWEFGLKAGPAEARRTVPPRVLDDLLSSAAATGMEHRVVVIVDEVPVLARAMEHASPGSGAAVLDTLRRVRQEQGNGLSMLLLWSIGFHHVAKSSPGSLNDLTKQQVQGLSEADGCFLARCLMIGASIDAADPASFALAVYQAAEGIPYYIQHLVRDARDHSRAHGTLTRDVPAELVDRALHHEDDPWNLRHYRDRVPEYYPGREELAYAALDIYAGATQPLDIDAALRLLGATTLQEQPTRRAFIDLVELLEQDHYLARHADADTFRSEIVRRAWIATWR